MPDWSDLPDTNQAEAELVHREAGLTCEEARRIGGSPCAGAEVPETKLWAAVLLTTIHDGLQRTGLSITWKGTGGNGCWRSVDADGRPCDAEPDPASPSGLCREHSHQLRGGRDA